MEGYVQTVLSIAGGAVVSAVLFVVTYRQTIGARQERARAANAEVEKILLNRIVLESYEPSADEVSLLLEGKARDYRVRSRALMTPMQVLTTLYTRLMETEFIDPERRATIVNRLIPLLVRTEEEEEAGEERAAYLASGEFPTLLAESTSRMALLAGLMASVTGGVTALAISADSFDSVTVVAVAGAFTGSLMLISMVWLILRARELPEVGDAASAYRTTVGLENEVRDILGRAGANPRLSTRGPRDQEFDFEARLNGKTTLLEVKAWPTHVPVRLIQAAATRLLNAVERLKADEGILVTKEPLDVDLSGVDDSRLRLMTAQMLKDHLGSSKN